MKGHTPNELSQNEKKHLRPLQGKHSDSIVCDLVTYFSKSTIQYRVCVCLTLFCKTIFLLYPVAPYFYCFQNDVSSLSYSCKR